MSSRSEADNAPWSIMRAANKQNHKNSVDSDVRSYHGVPETALVAIGRCCCLAFSSSEISAVISSAAFTFSSISSFFCCGIESQGQLATEVSLKTGRHERINFAPGEESQMTWAPAPLSIWNWVLLNRFWFKKQLEQLRRFIWFWPTRSRWLNFAAKRDFAECKKTEFLVCLFISLAGNKHFRTFLHAN